MLHDLRIALRSLARRPGFATAVVATLALGLGANAALFGLVDAVMLRALPYPQADRLVALFETVTRGDTSERRTLSYPDFEAIRDEVPALDAVAAWSGTSFVVDGGERAVRIRGERVTPGYFDVLGVAPARGGGFTDDGAGRGVDQVLVGHELWQSSFGGDSAIVGRTLRLDGEPHEIVGVMPAGFGGVSDDQELWTALGALPEGELARDNRFLGAVGRRAEGASLEQVNEQLSTVFARLEEEFPDENTGYSALATSLHGELVGDLQRPVRLLLVAVALLLLIACANVANLLLVHRIHQRRQAAIRLALGAGHGDLVRWSVVEVLVLGLAGGTLGLLCATWGLAALIRLAPVELPAFATISVNGQVILFGFLLAAVVASVLGLATALQIRRDTAPALLRQGAATVEGPRDGARRWLLAAEIALALLVVIGALSTLQSWRSITRIDPGFEARAAVAQLTLPAPAAEDPEPGDDELDDEAFEARLVAMHDEVLAAMASIPGAAEVALTSDTPLEGGYSATVVSPEGATPRPGEPYGGAFRTYVHTVSAGYFDTLGIPLLRGQGLGGADLASEPAAVVSRRLAERLWPGMHDPVGRRFKLGPPRAADAPPSDQASPWITVVGMVGEVRHRNLVPNPERVAEDPDLYLPLAQWPRRSVSGLVRPADGRAAAMLPALRRHLEALRADVPVFGLRTLADDLATQTARSRFGSVLMSVFALLSLLLAALGIYAVMAYRVSEQTREIGIRMALGADRARVLRLALGEGLRIAALGLAGGTLAALAAARLVAADDLLYGIDPGDPRILAMALGLLGLVTVLACALPARRASRVDPLVALREE